MHTHELVAEKLPKNHDIDAHSLRSWLSKKSFLEAQFESVLLRGHGNAELQITHPQTRLVIWLYFSERNLICIVSAVMAMLS